jgi:hypothetical protein
MKNKRKEKNMAKKRSRVKDETGGVENLYCGISVN